MTRNARMPLTYLGLGTLLFALGPALLKLMTTMGGRFGIANPGAISFCNVLFVGNLCAGLVTLVAFGPRRIASALFRLPRKTKLTLVLGALVSTIYPALIFTALERTSVINVVLLSRFNGIVFVALAFLVFRTPVRKAEVAGYIIIGVGVLLLVGLSDGTGMRSGELLVLTATVFFALTEFISKAVLRHCPIEVYVFFRNLVSALIFFVVAIYLFGIHHFADAFSGELWILMVVYAGLAVVAAQLLWLKATRVLPVKTIANSQLLNPIFSILFAYLLLGEVPSGGEWLVMGIVLAGMLVPTVTDWSHDRRGARGLTYAAGMVGTH